MNKYSKESQELLDKRQRWAREMLRLFENRDYLEMKLSYYKLQKTDYKLAREIAVPELDRIWDRSAIMQMRTIYDLMDVLNDNIDWVDLIKLDDTEA